MNNQRINLQVNRLNHLRFIPRRVLAVPFFALIASCGSSSFPTEPEPATSDIADPIADSPSTPIVDSGEYGAFFRPLPDLQAGQRAILLPSGDWLVTGGHTQFFSHEFVSDGFAREIQVAQLARPRADHVATLLPSGGVFVHGGVDEFGTAISDGEIIELPTGASTLIAESSNLFPSRSGHTATVLETGEVLLVGGTPADFAAVWNPDSERVFPVEDPLIFDRTQHRAALLPDGRVLVAGGQDSEGEDVEIAEVFYPSTRSFFALTDDELANLPESTWSSGTPSITQTNPVDGQANVPVNTKITVQFSKYLDVRSLNTETLRLSSLSGPVVTTVTPVEGGMMAFVNPAIPLQAFETYELVVSGAADESGEAVPEQVITFQTGDFEALSTIGDVVDLPDIVEPDIPDLPVEIGGLGGVPDVGAWLPVHENGRYDWTLGDSQPVAERQQPLEAAAGVTAVSGEIRNLRDQPVPGVKVSIGDVEYVTDATGRFLIEGIESARHLLVVDGRDVSLLGESRYGVFMDRVPVEAGKTNVLPFVIWLPDLDLDTRTSLLLSPVQPTVVTSPRIPGLEVTIPAGTVLRGHDGNLLTEITLTPLPTDRPPFPSQFDDRFGVFVTTQQGGAALETLDGSPSPGMSITYPNNHGLAPGSRVDLWAMDAPGMGWYVYGQGTVSEDGEQVVPDEGAVVHHLSCASTGLPDFAPQTGPPASPSSSERASPEPRGDCDAGPGGGGCDGEAATDGEPVDLASGLFIYRRQEVTISDVMPINLVRTYRQNDMRRRSFGIGSTHNYDYYIVGNRENLATQVLVMPDGSRIAFDRTNEGSYFATGIYEALTTPTRFYKAQMRWNTQRVGWDVTLVDGMRYEFSTDFTAETVQLTGIVDINGNRLSIERTPANSTPQGGQSSNISRISTPHGRSIEFEYFGDQITKITDHTGRELTYSYISGQLRKATDSIGGETEYTYDAFHRMTSITDPRGIVYLENEYDVAGRVAKQVQADDGEYAFEYVENLDGDIIETRVTDPRGMLRVVQFDSLGYPSSDIRASGTAIERRWTYTRDSVSSLLSELTDPLGRKTRYERNSNGQVSRVLVLADTPEQIDTEYTYSGPNNRISRVKDPNGFETRFEYDSVGNLVKVIDALGHNPVRANYDSLGRPVTITGGVGQTVTLTYDGADLVKVADGLSRETTMHHDALGRTVRITNPAGEVSTSTFDDRDRVISHTNALGHVIRFEYDANDNMTKFVDSKLGEISWVYDDKDRIVSRSDQLLRVESYAYDLNDNLVNMTDRNGYVHTYVYDLLNRMIRSIHPATNPTQDIGLDLGVLTQDLGLTVDGRQIDYTYDAGSRVTRIDDTRTGTIEQVFDNLDRLTAETTSAGTVSYGYDKAGRRTSMTDTEQQLTTYSYDSADRLIAILRAGVSVGYEYDAANRRTGLNLPGGIRMNYQYDSGDQIQAIEYVRGGSMIGLIDYNYDSAGRRSGMSGSYARNLLPEAVASATYTADNRLQQWGDRQFAYDDNGNMLYDGQQLYTWDSENQLAEINGASDALFSYDSKGRRTQKSIGIGPVGTSTSFVYDGLNTLTESVDAQGLTALISGPGFDQFVARVSGQGAESIIHDALGSAIELSDQNGNLQTKYTYSPFGLTLSTGAEAGNSNQHTRRENDGTTGLHYLRARYYHPQLRRFISEDPIGLAGGLNTYSYVANKPINSTDPLGLSPCPTPPLAPPGVNVNDNIYIAKDYSWLNPGATLAFYHLVQNNGPWDYKRQGQGNTYEDFGNFNFGATAAAMGMPQYIAQNGAGIYQQLRGAAAAGQGKPFFEWPYGDDPADAKMIQSGYDYTNNNCGCVP